MTRPDPISRFMNGLMDDDNENYLLALAFLGLLLVCFACEVCIILFTKRYDDDGPQTEREGDYQLLTVRCDQPD